MQRKIEAGRVYHLFNRGVDKRKIFLEDEDFYRFVHDLFEFNDDQPINNLTYQFKAIARPYIGNKNSERRPRKLLIEILAFCLMPNHYHLLVKPLKAYGVTKFMKRLNMGYAQYFNGKYKRSGALFEGRYKSVPVLNETHFIHLPYYIHCNPLDLISPEWKKRELKNYKKTVKFLETYRWSSHLDYIGKKNFPSVTQREFLLKFFGGSQQYKKDITNWLKDLDLETITDLILD